MRAARRAGGGRGMNDDSDVIPVSITRLTTTGLDCKRVDLRYDVSRIL